MKYCGVELEGTIKEGQECYYVPIQKVTIGCLLRAADFYCENCESKKCDECCLKSAINKADWSIHQEPMLDGDLNIVTP